MQTAEQIIEQLQHDVKMKSVTLAKMAERLNTGESLLYTLEGSDQAFADAARIDAARFALAVLTHAKGGVDETITLLEREVMNMAKYPKHSTSPIVNYAAQCKMAAYATLLENMRSWTA